MPGVIAGIDVHKKMLAVVVADVEPHEEHRFERFKVGTRHAELRGLADWLVEHDVEEEVMESTALYRRPCGRRWSCTGGRRAGRAKARPQCGTLHLARAQSNCGARFDRSRCDTAHAGRR
jgi:hypothetical protein